MDFPSWRLSAHHTLIANFFIEIIFLLLRLNQSKYICFLLMVKKAVEDECIILLVYVPPSTNTVVLTDRTYMNS